MDLFVLSYLVLWLVVVVEAAALLLVLRTFGSFYLSTASGVSRDGIPIGALAPDFELPALDGTRFGLRSLRGRWLVLFFADPMCQECYVLLDALNRLQTQLGKTGSLVFMFRGELEDARAFPALAKASIPVIPIGRRGLIERYRVRVSPFVQIVDPQGIVRAKGVARHTDSIAHLLSDAGLDHKVTKGHRHERRRIENPGMAGGGE
ncbi:MAG: peroxiredoxin family protein [Candidatus Limnocylindria bacterium]